VADGAVAIAGQFEEVPANGIQPVVTGQAAISRQRVEHFQPGRRACTITAMARLSVTVGLSLIRSSSA
jgi:hypothetical protein